ncbi:MAG: hypothetical protein AAGF97_14505, partial [Planctomycetota bacterium]
RFVLAQPDDFARSEYWLWVAAMALEKGDLKRAATSLSHVDRMGLGDYYRTLYQMVGITLRVIELPATNQNWTQAFGRFKVACDELSPAFHRDALLGRLQGSYMKRIAQHFGQSVRAALKALPRRGRR